MQLYIKKEVLSLINYLVISLLLIEVAYTSIKFFVPKHLSSKAW